MKYAGIKNYILLICLFLYFALSGGAIWLIKPDPMLAISIPLRFLASIGAVIVFFKWRDWRILFVGAMILFTAIRLCFTLLLGANILERTICIEQLKEFPSLLASILACLSIVYLWRVFEKSRRVRIAESERDKFACSLAEQSKTLDCLDNLAFLLRSEFISLSFILEQAVKIIPKAFEKPSIIGVRINLGGHTVTSEKFMESISNICNEFSIKGKSEKGLLELSVFDDDNANCPYKFSEYEKNSVPTIALLLGIAVERSCFIGEVNRSKQLLEEQKDELEQKNSALNEILDHIEAEREKVQDEVVSNIESFIMPLIEKLSVNVSSSQKGQFDVLKNNLDNILSAFGKKISENETRLSPREIEICNLIKNGLSSKEIADLLKISIRTVERYRYNIRVKLDIVNQKINLITYLKSI